jgi:predicted secreted protein
VGRRHLTTAVTLLVLLAILVIGGYLGVHTLLSPLPSSDKPSATPSATCSTQPVRKGQRVRSRDVVVSVYNGGTRSGLADDTMTSLNRRGFKRGSVGNAPPSVKVRRVVVRTTDRHDAAALLVARQFGASTKVRVTSDDIGPGIDVIVGDGFHKLAKASRVYVVKKSSSVCVPLSSPSDATSG